MTNKTDFNDNYKKEKFYCPRCGSQDIIDFGECFDCKNCTDTKGMPLEFEKADLEKFKDKSLILSNQEKLNFSKKVKIQLKQGCLNIPNKNANKKKKLLQLDKDINLINDENYDSFKNNIMCQVALNSLENWNKLSEESQGNFLDWIYSGDDLFSFK